MRPRGLQLWPSIWAAIALLVRGGKRSVLAMYVSFLTTRAAKAASIFVVAGFVAKADPNWLNFSDAWASVIGGRHR